MGRDTGLVEFAQPCSPSPSLGALPPLRPRLLAYKLSNSRRFAVTHDSSNQLQLWDLLQASSRALGPLDPALSLEDKAAELDAPELHVSSWCALDVRLGSLAVHLEYPGCFAGRVDRLDFDQDPLLPRASSQRNDDETLPCEVDLAKAFLECAFSGLEACLPALEPPASAPPARAAVGREALGLAALPDSCVLEVTVRGGLTLAMSRRGDFAERCPPLCLPKWLALCLAQHAHPNPRMKERVEFKIHPLPGHQQPPGVFSEEKLIKTQPQSTIHQIALYLLSLLAGAVPHQKFAVELYCRCRQQDDPERFRRLPVRMNLDALRKYHWHRDMPLIHSSSSSSSSSSPNTVQTEISEPILFYKVMIVY